MYYNDIRNRMNSTRTKLEKSGRQRELHRRARKRAGFKTVSLAGYTSAGKTTLFNAMTGESNEKGDELFTTLSTTTRRARVGGRAPEPVLVSDTVGFISRLPAYMIEAFRSTLEELGHADVIVLVVDFADPVPAARRKIASCHAALGELGVREERVIYALNKADMIAQGADAAERRAERLGIAGADTEGRWVAVSAKTGANIDGLKDMIAGMAFGPAAGGAGRPGRWGKKDSRVSEAGRIGGNGIGIGGRNDGGGTRGGGRRRMTATIEVLRIGQRPVRDDRVTTHAALVARAFGASMIYMTEANPEIRQGIRAINETWGGRFEVEYVDGWRPVLHEKMRQGYTVVHLSMYGESINDVQDELRRRAADGAAKMLIVVGAKKVPREVYDAADYNVSVGGQPHSEIAAPGSPA